LEAFARAGSILSEECLNDRLRLKRKAKEVAAMTLVDIVVILVIAGLLMWLINTYIPMAAAIKSLLNILVFVVLLIWVLQSLGIIGEVAGVRIPPLK
jgi:small-conductance mechanosensitive channel